MSIIKLIQSIQRLNKKLGQSSNLPKPTPKKSLPRQQKRNVKKSLPIQSFRLFVIGIPLMKGVNDSLCYSRLNAQEKAEVILKAVCNSIKKIQDLYKLTKKDTVIIQLREYAFTASETDFVTVKERNEILRILSRIFPTHFNLIIGTGGMAYATPLPSEQALYKRKIQHTYNNYLKLQQEHPKFFKNGALLHYEQKRMNDNLKQGSVNMVLHNKNYLLTNKHNLKTTPPNKNKSYLPFSKVAPFRETDQQLSFEHSMIYNPGKKKENFPLDSNIFIHNLTCSEALFSRLMKHPSPLPSLLLINSATCTITSQIIKKIEKWHNYFFQVDSRHGCQYGVFNKRTSKTHPHIKFYEYNIYNSALEEAKEVKGVMNLRKNI
jgi:hypothetical protein